MDLAPPAAPFAPYLSLDRSLAALRAGLGLRSLTPAERRAGRGKWFRSAKLFAERAARIRRRYAADLAELPYGAEDLLAQKRRVEELEDAVIHLRRLCKEAEDTLLCERARLYDMGTGVLATVELLRARPFAPPALRERLSAAARVLRQPFAERAARVRAAKRRKAREGAALAAAAGPVPKLQDRANVPRRVPPAVPDGTAPPPPMAPTSPTKIAPLPALAELLPRPLPEGDPCQGTASPPRSLSACLLLPRAVGCIGQVAVRLPPRPPAPSGPRR